MNGLLRTGLASWLLLAAGPALADEVRLRDGTVVAGEVLAVEASGVRVRVAGGGERALPAADLDPESHTALLAARAGEKPADRLALARTLLRAGLHGPARIEARSAAEADPSLAVAGAQVLSEANEAEARALLGRGLARIAGGEADAGRRLLLEVVNRFPLSAAMTGAADALLRDPAPPPPAPPAVAGPPAPAEEPAALRPLSALLARAAKLRDDAAKVPVERGDRRQKALGEAEEALLEAARAVPALRRAAAAPAPGIEKKEAEIRAALVSLYTAASRLLVESRDASAARVFLYRGLALAPSDPELLGLQTLITRATFDEDPWHMTMGELSRRVAAGTATAEMVRIYRRRTGTEDPGAPPSGR
ncbi:MAG: hypothetical protein L0216_17440 [Planctomycetales bacterium]|nr:hypothetical protein [Planctomycetales bacterium]